MKKIYYFFTFLSSIVFCTHGRSQSTSTPGFNKSNITTFYNALSGSDTVKINNSLQSFKPLANTYDKAYTGALLMKKSDLVKSAKRKMDLFKEGKVLLEDAIKTESNNGEFRFLRLIIQEHCPEIVKYQNSIKVDAEMVKNTYVQFSPELQRVVLDYSKSSKALKSLEAN